jgi:hypothetical protein
VLSSANLLKALLQNQSRKPSALILVSLQLPLLVEHLFYLSLSLSLPSVSISASYLSLSLPLSLAKSCFDPEGDLPVLAELSVVRSLQLSFILVFSTNFFFSNSRSL